MYLLLLFIYLLTFGLPDFDIRVIPASKKNELGNGCLLFSGRN